MAIFLFAFFLSGGLLSPACAAAAKDRAPAPQPLTKFAAGGAEGWRQRTWKPDGSAELSALAVEKYGPKDAGAACLRLPVKFPGKPEFVSPVRRDWSAWQRLEFEFFLPRGLPERTVVYLFTKDRDYLWRQIRLRLPPERDRFVRISVPISGPEAAARWEPRGHQRPWHQLTPAHLLEYGCSFELDTGVTAAYAGQIGLRAVRLRDRRAAGPDRPLADFHFQPRNPHVGRLCEFTFRVNAWYADPFDPAHAAVRAEIERPDGQTDVLRGFYFEDFLYDREVADKTRVLTPFGAPCFKVRYSPRLPGRHVVRIRARIEGRELRLPPVAFIAREALPDYRGVIKIDPENSRLLAWGNNEPFWGIGLNVRSPYDTRYLKVAPYSKWLNEGLPLYDRLFATYEKYGINVVEVWMSSWWLALEWIPDAPGFHGVGYYNPYRAWMLDHILRQAEKHGIYLILVFNNHGKFGALNDTEWARNPYNVKNGGFLQSCEEYFTDERAKNAFKRLCDYIVARWGYSDHILSWKLFTEIDLTGTSYEFYQQPEVAAWHREMGRYLKKIDPWHHLVTTHWMLGYYRINDDIAVLPELDLLTTDAYYQGKGGAQASLLTMLRGGAQFAREKKKPLLITEFGGSPHADSMGNLIKQAHLGIWTGFFHEAPAAPMFWWFALVDEKNLYGNYSALRAFVEGDENRRALVSTYEELEAPGLALNEMRGKKRLYLWLFDTKYYFSDEENLVPRTIGGTVLKRPAPAPGAYTVEFWDCHAGRVLSRQPLAVASGQTGIELTLPSFRRDIAVKIKPAASAE